MDLIAATGLAILLKNWIQVVDFSAHVTLKFDGWHRKILRQALCIISRYPF